MEMAALVLSRWKLLTLAPLAAGAIALGATYLIAPTFTARTVFLPPQPQGSAAASAMASLGSLAGLAGGAIKTSGDQYVSLLQSANVTDKLVDKFALMREYEAKYRFLAREGLAKRSRIQLGKKDGLITVEVDATSPELAANIANQYVVELRRLTSELALTEAQQRRAFYEGELKTTRGRLAESQTKLQTGGFNSGAIKAEPKAMAESYAKAKAELTSAEVRLQTLRQSRSDNAPEVQQQLALVGALRTQLSRLESKHDVQEDANYLSQYREFKYQESLYELFSKQYELARLDESREGVAVQVVDAALPPEYKSKPKRASTALSAALATFVLLVLGIVGKEALRKATCDPKQAQQLQRMKHALRGQAV
jgi:uncharacterized protein involved in exopolysaccharide biosynthesis